MNSAEDIAARLERVFTIIEKEQMAGIPVLNLKLEVEAIGFHDFEGRCLGVIITPWLMNLMLFPSIDDEWSGLGVGDRHSHEFPVGRRDFIVNHFDEIGICHTRALYSPMSGFSGQEQARIAARRAMNELMTRKEHDGELDEKHLERLLRGEDMHRIGQSKSKNDARPVKAAPAPQIARSDFIRGRFSGKNRA